MIGVTLGDPSGIGPEIVAKSIRNFGTDQILLIGSKENFVNLLPVLKMDERLLSGCKFVDVGGERVSMGKIQKAGGEIAIKSIEVGVQMAMKNEIAALATAPINKEALRLAGSKYIDHTTMLAGLTGCKDVSTVFETGNLRIFFMTKHISLVEACGQISEEHVFQSIINASRCLDLLGIKGGKVAVAALNPHSGEHGLMGNEETLYIEPAIKRAHELINVEGPFPADSVFYRASKGEFSIVISLYHDQGHIAAKMLDFYSTVSMNIGLPFLRTSVDHGTAFDIAGKNVANEISMVQAIEKAIKYGNGYRKKFAEMEPITVGELAIE